MLPEPTLPKRRRTAPTPTAGSMTPLFPVPDGSAVPRPRGARPPGRARSAARGHKEPAELLTVTAERLRRALSRSFLRYGISADADVAVHAAMNVIEPVLEARDTEILRLRRLSGKLPRR
jgi:hypothetical protein